MARFEENAGSVRVRPPALGPPDSNPAALARTIESEIIPRLMLLHRDADAGRGVRAPGASEIAHLANLILADGTGPAFAHVAALQTKGLSLETILLGHFAPAARLLGDLWREDLASFADVTIAMSRLQQMLRLLGAPFGHAGDGEPDGRRVLLAPVPGEQHAFGITVVEALMRRSGWDVEVAWNSTEARLTAAVRAEHYDLIGLSLSCDVLLPALRSTIQTIRRASGNRTAKIIVGGRYFIENPDMVERVGADAGAVDARDAILQADRLVAVPVASR